MSDTPAGHDDGGAAVLTVPAQPRVRPSARTRPDTRPAPLWNVVLLDDQDHSYEYVIDLMQKVFGHPVERSFLIAKTVDKEGRAVCYTTHKEHAELKLEQVQGFGADPRIASCKGAMSAIIEPADLSSDE